MRNDMVGFRVLDKKGRVMTDWGRLVIADLIPGDDCWGRLVFKTHKAATVTMNGVPQVVQVAVNTVFPSELYDIHLFEDKGRAVKAGRQIEVSRVTIDIEGCNGVWGEE